MCEKLTTDRGLCLEKSPSFLLNSDKAFSLIEVLVAMLLLMVGLFAWMQLQVAAIKVVEASKTLMIAQDKISQELEQIKTIGYIGIRTNAVLTNNPPLAVDPHFDYKSALTGLDANYQFAGIDTSCNAPAAYCVYKQMHVDKVVNGLTVSYYYTVKLAVNPGYLSYPEIAKVDATVYWKSNNLLKNMQISSFVGF